MFTEPADKLLSKAISDFILGLPQGDDVQVHWHLPWIVRAERNQQMLAKARTYIPTLNKIERLLGHQLAITPDILDARVQEAIARQVELHKLQIIEPDLTKINWDEMIRRSVCRLPPFDSGESEKGFRDALVLESFCHLTTSLPRSPQSCRIILMCNDGLLAQAAKERIADRSNCSVVSELDGLKTMLAALTSQLTQERIGEILPNAAKFFFVKEDASTLWFKAEVSKRLDNDFGDTIHEPPDDGFTVTVKAILIYLPPAFLAKDGQRLTFSTRVYYSVQARKTIWKSPLATLMGGLGSTYASGPPSAGTAPSSATSGVPHDTGIASMGAIFGAPPPLLPPPPPPPQPTNVLKEGSHEFSVTWSVTLMSNGKLKNGKLEKVELQKSSWQDAS